MRLLIKTSTTEQNCKSPGYTTTMQVSICYESSSDITNRLRTVNNTNNIANSVQNIRTATKKLSSEKNAFGHWSKHKFEFQNC